MSRHNSFGMAAVVAALLAVSARTALAVPITGVSFAPGGGMLIDVFAEVTVGFNQNQSDSGSISVPQPIVYGSTATQSDAAQVSGAWPGFEPATASAGGEQSVTVGTNSASGTGSASLTVQQTAISLSKPSGRASVFQSGLRFDTAANADFVFRYAFTSVESSDKVLMNGADVHLGDSFSTFEYFTLTTRNLTGNGTIQGTTRDLGGGLSNLQLYISQQLTGSIGSLSEDGSFTGAFGFVWDLQVADVGESIDLNSLSALPTPTLPSAEGSAPVPATLWLMLGGLLVMITRHKRANT